MQRAQLLGLLSDYNPADPTEIIFKQRIIEFVNKHDACFERSLSEGHITASCWLIDNNNSCALLTHHTKLDKWFQLGGHCDGDPDVLAVAIKEAVVRMFNKWINPSALIKTHHHRSSRVPGNG